MIGGSADRLGYPAFNPGRLDTSGAIKMAPGSITFAIDPFWGGGEFIYCRATAAIPQFGLVNINGSWDSTNLRWSVDATPLANTANQGVDVGVAMTKTTASGQYIWVKVTGITPINCNSSLAVGALMGVVAAGQGGAVTAGKQILGISVIALATTTVVKNGCFGIVGQTILQVPNSDGWFLGGYISGTGIPASTTITDISDDGQVVTLSAALTAVPSTVTVTYNNGTVYYPICFINRPGAQGQIS
jgi:hypothetical protein